MFRDYDEPDIPAPVAVGSLRISPHTQNGAPFIECNGFWATGPINLPTGPAKDYADDPKEESLRQAFITPKPRKYIWWDKKRKSWRVRIARTHLGYYPTLSLAVKARNAHCKLAGITMGRGE
jgi:hypothetical protein